MRCLGCYREDTEGYCLKCRKKLFDGGKVSSVLAFAAPRDSNLSMYQGESKKAFYFRGADEVFTKTGR